MSRNDPIRELEDLGETIQDIIDQAVNSRDYQRLNQTISQAVNRAVDSGTEAVRRAAQNASMNQRRVVNSSAQGARRGDPRENKNIYSSKLGSMSAASNKSAYQQQEKKENLPALYRPTNGKMAGGILQTVGGGLLTFGTTLDLISTAVIRTFFAPGAFLSVLSVMMMAGLGAGVFLLSRGVRTITRLKRFDKYVNALGNKTYCELEQLARSVGKPVRYVKKELHKMIDEGLFLEGHMDQEETSLITSNETFHHYQQTQRQLEEKKRREIIDAQVVQPSPKIGREVQEVLDRGNAFIRQIRSCNDRIPGEEISGKISRMELIVQKIFDRAEAHPEIVPDLKKLMDYYLPMTVKLLNAYAEMDAQPIQGDTIQTSKREIEATLDTLNAAFEKLLDSVFKDAALDVSSDINVLQTLLAQEGLTDDELMSIKKEKMINLE